MSRDATRASSRTTAGDAQLDHVAALERRLLDADTRRDRARMEALLHPDFHEIGSSGTLWNREQIIVALLSEDPAESIVPCDITARYVVADVVLLTYALGASWRSSLWVRRTSGWRVLFHQGTPIGARADLHTAR